MSYMAQQMDRQIEAAQMNNAELLDEVARLERELAELRAKGSLPSLKEIKDAVRGSGFATHEQCWQIAGDVLAMLSARPTHPNTTPTEGRTDVE